MPVAEHIREQSPDFRFISPLLFVKVPESTRPEYLLLKKQMEGYAHQAIAAHKATDISVYTRDLNTSEWVGYDPDKKYSAASMLKVVSLLAALREAELNRKLMSSTIYITPDSNEVKTQDYFPPTQPLEVGKRYTFQHVLHQLITESDNAANEIVYRVIRKETIDKTYVDLQLPIPHEESDHKSKAQYSPRDYSHVLRVLYNATYLSRPLSEQALDLLSQTTYDRGLVAGVPAGISVSHKFGQRTTSVDQGRDVTRELHDCGIVYHPRYPYVICVMTRGETYSDLELIIKDISKLVWQHADRALP